MFVGVYPEYQAFVGEMDKRGAKRERNQFLSFLPLFLSFPSRLKSPLSFKKPPEKAKSQATTLSCKPPQNVRRIFCVNGSWKVGLQEEIESNVLFNPEPQDDLFCFSSPKSRNQVGILMIYRKWSVTQILENRRRF